MTPYQLFLDDKFVVSEPVEESGKGSCHDQPNRTRNSRILRSSLDLGQRVRQSSAAWSGFQPIPHGWQDQGLPKFVAPDAEIADVLKELVGFELLRTGHGVVAVAIAIVHVVSSAIAAVIVESATVLA